MELSIAGLLICFALVLVAQFFEGRLIVASIASFTFGATALVTVPALGGASPLICMVFLVALMATVALRPGFLASLAKVFAQQPAAWLILFLLLYSIVGALTLPRIFAGSTTVFVPVRIEGRVAEVLLSPTSGNISQLLYFTIACLSFFALSILLPQRNTLSAVRNGFFVFVTLHVALGFIDLFGKAAGLGDVLAPIRSASYAMHTNVDVAGFARIAGAQAEASSFGARCVSLLAFTYCYWRGTQSRNALLLSIALLALLILSTSTTAYVGGAILALFLLASLAGAAVQNRLRKQDLVLLVGAFAALTLIVGVVVYNNTALDPFWKLFDAMILDKSSSDSGQERAYWNAQSLQSVLDTVGLGIGLGSSRASSWIIAVISQLGIVGSLLIGLLVVEIIRSGDLRHARELDQETRATALSLRATALATLLTETISGGGVNPGVIFFMTLAVVLSLKASSPRRSMQPNRVPPWHSGIVPAIGRT
jgi:hypothetical protein